MTHLGGENWKLCWPGGGVFCFPVLSYNSFQEDRNNVYFSLVPVYLLLAGLRLLYCIVRAAETLCFHKVSMLRMSVSEFSSEGAHLSWGISDEFNVLFLANMF